MKFILGIAAFLIGSTAAFAQCEVPPTQPNPDNISFIMGIEPSDGILDVWCRIQALQGEYRVNILFPGREGAPNGAHRTFVTTFDGTYSQDRMELATFIQSLLPTEDGPAEDEQGMNFGKVLESATQARAARTPTGEPLGVPAVYPFANDLVLWEPVALRIRPVMLAGVEFEMTVNFRPSVGRYMMQVNGEAEDLVFKGWHANVLRKAGPARDNCPAEIPECKDFGDIIDVHAAWVVDNIIIRANGTGLSAAAMTILGQIAADNPKFVSRNVLSRFSPTRGEASFDVSGTAREILARADGDKAGAAGTQTIRILWGERAQSKVSYRYMLEDYGRRVREAMVLANPIQ